MPDLKISQLDSNGALSGTDLLALAQASTTVKLSLSDLVDYLDQFLVAVNQAATITVTDAVTNNQTDVLLLGHETSGTPANGLGVAIRLRAESSTTSNTLQGAIITEWVDVTHASRKSRLTLGAYDTVIRPAISMEGSGTAAMIGFLGASAVVRPSSTTDLRQALIDLGLYTTGGATPLNLNGGALTSGNFSQTGASTFSTGTGNVALNGTTFIGITDAVTNAVTTALFLDHATSGTPAPGYGQGIRFRSNSNGSVNRSQAGFESLWVVATDASRTARLAISAYDFNGAKEGIRIEADGTVAKIGFLGALAVARPASTDDLRQALIDLGLYASGGATPLNLNGGALTAGNISQAGASTFSTGTGAVSLNGVTAVAVTDATTSSVTTTLFLDHASSGTPAAGFGNGIRLRSSSDTTANRTLGTIEGLWVSATDASRTARLVLSAYDSVGAKEGIRLEGDGSAARIGFLGANAVVRPSSTTDLRVALINLGLYTSGGASPLDLNGGAFIASTVATTSTITSGGQIRAQGAGGNAVLVEDLSVADGSRPFGVFSTAGGVVNIGNANRSGTSTTSTVARISIAATGEVTVTSTAAAGLVASGGISVAGVGTFGAAVTTTVTDAGTANIATGLTLAHLTSGTPAAGFGTGLTMQAETSTGATASQMALESSWVDATNGTRKARVGLYAYDTTFREVFRGEASGSAPMIGFLGASAVVRPTSTTDLRQALIDLGLYTTGGATPLNLNGGALTAANITSSALTANQVVVASTSGLLSSSANVTYTATGGLNVTTSDAITNTVTTTLFLDHATSGTPTPGYGQGVRFRASSNGSTNRSQASFDSLWVVATDASRTARFVISAYDFNGAKEGIRVEADGTAVRLGFYGSNAIVKPSSTTDLRTALINLGLYTTGGATPLDLNGGALSAASGSFIGTSTGIFPAMTGRNLDSGSNAVTRISLANDASGFFRIDLNSSTNSASSGVNGGRISCSGGLQLSTNSGVNSLDFNSTNGSTLSSFLLIQPNAVSSGSALAMLTLNGPANTGVSIVGTDYQDVYLNLARTVQFSTTASKTAAHGLRILAPTFSSATAADTLPTSATLTIEGAPTDGTNLTTTNKYALLVRAGAVSIAGAVTTGALTSSQVTSGTNSTAVTNMTNQQLFTPASGSTYIVVTNAAAGKLLAFVYNVGGTITIEHYLVPTGSWTYASTSGVIRLENSTGSTQNHNTSWIRIG